MWKTQHMVILAVCVTIASVTLTLYAESRLKNAIASRATELTGTRLAGTSLKDKTSNPIQLMSALSSKNKPDDLQQDFSIPRLPEEPTSSNTTPKSREIPKGAGSRWTPL